MNRIQLFLFAALIFSLNSCTSLRPCCRLRTDYSTMERSRQVKLDTRPPTHVAAYTNEAFTILVKRSRAEKKLERFVASYSDTLSVSIFDRTKDTLQLHVQGTNRRLKKFLITQMKRGRAVVIDRSTGSPVDKAELRTFNFMKGPRWGAGG
jgi:7-keto-8-aminopelargonate synthetase-like enzyme